MATEGTALRKRQQIAKANRMMFLWVARISAIVGVAAVASLFLVQKALFNEKVLAEKAKTASILQDNNDVVEELQSQIRKLNTNEDLINNMVAKDEEAQPIQVVLDALPSTANSSAFGASLQQRFLHTDDIRLDSLRVEPVRNVESSSGSSRKSSSSSKGGSNYQIRFSFDVNARANNPDALQELLVRLERSIRPITVTSATIEARGNRLVLRVDGHTYYQPAEVAELRDKVVKP